MDISQEGLFPRENAAGQAQLRNLREEYIIEKITWNIIQKYEHRLYKFQTVTYSIQYTVYFIVLQYIVQNIYH